MSVLSFVGLGCEANMVCFVETEKRLTCNQEFEWCPSRFCSNLTVPGFRRQWWRLVVLRQVSTLWNKF